MPHSIPYNAKIFEARKSQNRKSSNFGSFGASPLECSDFGPSGQLLSLPLSILHRFQHTPSPLHPYSPFPLDLKASKLRISTSSGRAFGVRTFGPSAFGFRPRASSMFAVSSTFAVWHCLFGLRSFGRLFGDTSVVCSCFGHFVYRLPVLYLTKKKREFPPPRIDPQCFYLSLCALESLAVRVFDSQLRVFDSQLRKSGSPSSVL